MDVEDARTQPSSRVRRKGWARGPPSQVGQWPARDEGHKRQHRRLTAAPPPRPPGPPARPPAVWCGGGPARGGRPARTHRQGHSTGTGGPGSHHLRTRAWRHACRWCRCWCRRPRRQGGCVRAHLLPAQQLAGERKGGRRGRREYWADGLEDGDGDGGRMVSGAARESPGACPASGGASPPPRPDRGAAWWFPRASELPHEVSSRPHASAHLLLTSHAWTPPPPCPGGLVHEGLGRGTPLRLQQQGGGGTAEAGGERMRVCACVCVCVEGAGWGAGGEGRAGGGRWCRGACAVG